MHFASETHVTLSAIKPVPEPTSVVMSWRGKDEEPALTKEMKRVIREDLNKRHAEKAMGTR